MNFDDPKWWDKFDPSKPEKDYEWVVRTAKEKIALLVESADVLDRKADAVLRYISLVIAAFAAAAPFISRQVPYHLWAQPPAIFALVVAAVLAVAAARPLSMKALPELTLVFKSAEAFKTHAEVRYFAFTVPLEKSLMKLISTKGKLITAAIVCLLLALLWLAIATPIAASLGATTPTSYPPSLLHCCA